MTISKTTTTNTILSVIFYSAMSVESKGDRKSKEEFLFADGETVLCYHGPLLYEAKVQLTLFVSKIPISIKILIKID